MVRSCTRLVAGVGLILSRLLSQARLLCFIDLGRWTALGAVILSAELGVGDILVEVFLCHLLFELPLRYPLTVGRRGVRARSGQLNRLSESSFVDDPDGGDFVGSDIPGTFVKVPRSRGSPTSYQSKRGPPPSPSWPSRCRLVAQYLLGNFDIWGSSK
ncbi:hypothetical protein U1Q18_018422 [Sarracenia purpurea var. burkii]